MVFWNWSIEYSQFIVICWRICEILNKALWWNYIGATANAKVKIPLFFVATQCKQVTQNTMYPFKAMSLSRSLSLQYNCTLTSTFVPVFFGRWQLPITQFNSLWAIKPFLLYCQIHNNTVAPSLNTYMIHGKRMNRVNNSGLLSM